MVGGKKEEQEGEMVVTWGGGDEEIWRAGERLFVWLRVVGGNKEEEGGMVVTLGLEVLEIKRFEEQREEKGKKQRVAMGER